jgi:LytS/YehU family sensor histidine kinase
MNDPDKPTQIDLNVADSSIRFTIKNYKNNYLKDETGGIGIQNVQKRLDLLYPNQYTLKVDESGDQFIVDLQLPL